MKAALKWAALCLLAALGLQVFFALRVVSMAWIDPQSTTFERTQIWRMAQDSPHTRQRPWRQEWQPLARIGKPLQRAVIASEDDTFAAHNGLRWEAIEMAWSKNHKAQQQAKKQARQRPERSQAPLKIVGGSTITQQLAKNLFLSGERNLLRKGQEMVIVLLLEASLPKARILEIYLNHVEWGQGVFGAQAAAQHYFGKPAARLTAWEAARLAVMLPRPRFFEKSPQSAYLAERAHTIVGRMGAAQLP